MSWRRSRSQSPAQSGRERNYCEGVCTLTAWLRARSDAELRQLLHERPDLATPVPADLAALADRAGTQASVARALDRLDRAILQILEALAALSEEVEPVSIARLLRSLPPADAERAQAALSRLRTLALVWDASTPRGTCEPDSGTGDQRDGESSPSAPEHQEEEKAGGQLWVVPAVHRVLGRRPAGLGPPAATAFAGMNPGRLQGMLGDLGLDGYPGAAADPPAQARALADHLATPGVLDDLLVRAGSEARAVLDRLTWGPPVGTIADARRDVRLATATSPIEQLLARGLLAPAGGDTVVLPREVALHLRGGLLLRSVDPPPELEVDEQPSRQADQTAAGQAFATVRAVEGLLELYGADPPSVLRAGGLGVRELRRTARNLDLTEKRAAAYIEVAYAAGLLGSSGIDGEWAPTKTYDVWYAQSTEQRWVTLASAWLDSTRVPGLVGERDARNKTTNALGPEVERPGVAEMRREALNVLAELPSGSAASEESLRARLAWLRPRRWDHLSGQWLASILEEAETLGVTGLGALPAYGRAVLSGSEAEAAETLAPLLPELVDHVLVQPDLTAVAPGPLTPELDRELALAADVESTGGATVYRFTQSSVRRALDAGRSADDLLGLLDQHSRTPVPQPLHYLIRDVARAHGRIRVGTASAYVRCDDPDTLTELLADRRAARLGLRRLADTVLASRTSQQELVERLRALGYGPMAESAGGELLIARSDVRRVEPRERPPKLLAARPAEEPSSSERLASTAVRALRAGDRAATAARRPLGRPQAGGETTSAPGETGAAPGGAATPASPTVSAVAALRSAAGDGQPLLIGYLDAQGHASTRIVEPARVEGGFLTAYDNTRDAVHRFALHRITGVAVLDESPDSADDHHGAVTGTDHDDDHRGNRS